LAVKRFRNIAAVMAPPGAAADVGHVGIVALQGFVVFVVQRHAPGRVQRLFTGGQQLRSQRVVGAEQARAVVAQGDDAGTGERGDVHHHGRLEALGIGQRIAQDEAAFGVGVEDLDGLARQALDHVTGFDGAAAGQVLAGRDDADEVDLGLQLATARRVPSTLAAPPMSYFISSISAAGLSEMPPLSKVMPLPTSTTGATPLAAPNHCAR
jgi:hypothetical protein